LLTVLTLTFLPLIYFSPAVILAASAFTFGGFMICHLEQINYIVTAD
jgi:hypothetical protein